MSVNHQALTVIAASNEAMNRYFPTYTVRYFAVFTQ